MALSVQTCGCSIMGDGELWSACDGYRALRLTQRNAEDTLAYAVRGKSDRAVIKAARKALEDATRAVIAHRRHFGCEPGCRG